MKDEVLKDELAVRKHTVRCRLNTYEYQIFELLMNIRDQSHSDVLRSALLKELNQPIYEPLDLEHERAKNWLNNYIYKIKRPRQTLRIIEKFQHIDPALLSELSAIGNNLNQIARALNTLAQQANDKKDRVQVDYLQVLFILQNIANDIAPILKRLPKRKRNESAVKAKLKEKRGQNLVKTIKNAR
jgi:lysyl-tRNA synthetase class I